MNIENNISYHAAYKVSKQSIFSDILPQDVIQYPRSSVKKAILFFDKEIGKFPLSGPHQILNDPSWIVNHKNQLIKDIDASVPSDHDGLVIIDYTNKFYPHFDLVKSEPKHGFWFDSDFDANAAASQLFDNSDSDKNFIEDFYNWHWFNKKSEVESIFNQEGRLSLDNYMRSEWNKIMKDFLFETLLLSKQQRPNAKWTVLGVPYTIYSNPNLNGGGPRVFGYGRSSEIDISDKNQMLNIAQAANNDLNWFYDLVDFIIPKIFSPRFTVPNTKLPDQIKQEDSVNSNREFLRSNARECLRISLKHNKKFAPLIWHRYEANKKEPHYRSFLNSINWNNNIRVFLEERSSGSIFFDRLEFTNQDNIINNQYINILNPIIDETLQSNFSIPNQDISIPQNSDIIGSSKNQNDSDKPINEINRQFGRLYRLWRDLYLDPTNGSQESPNFWKSEFAVNNLIDRMTQDYNNGFRRFMLWLPGGGVSTELISPNHWFTLSSDRRQQLINKIQDWLSDREDAIISVYASGLFNNDISRIDAHDIIDNQAVFYDVNNQDHIDYFNQNWGSWIQDVGIKEIYLHYASRSNNKQLASQLAMNKKNDNIRIGGQGLPFAENGIFDEQFISRIPWVTSFENFRSIQGSDKFIFDSLNTEIGILLIPEMSISAEEISQISDQNVIIWSEKGYYDKYIIDAAGFNSSNSALNDNNDNVFYKVVTKSFDFPKPSSGNVKPTQEEIELSRGFGWMNYDPGFGGGVGDITSENYGNYHIVCEANAIDGTFKFNSQLNKYTKVEADIVNPSFKNTGLPHSVIEDSVEWINSGMPSHLSQVANSNLLITGINLKTKYPNLVEDNAPYYQSVIHTAQTQDWYDVFNSTIDFNLLTDTGNKNLFLPFPNGAIHLKEQNKVLVGGKGGVLSIDVESKFITNISLDPLRELFIKDMHKPSDKNIIYILNENSIYIYDILSSTVSRDPGIGLPTGLFKIVTLFGNIIIIGASDGIYARKTTQDEWTQVFQTTNAVENLIAPDAVMASAKDRILFSTDGFNWSDLGSVNKDVFDMGKFRSQILIGTNEGLRGDNGSFYAGETNVSLINFADNAAESKGIIVNDIDSTFDKSVFGTSDGKYIIWDQIGFNIVDVPFFKTIHKVLFVDNNVWTFSLNKFNVSAEDNVYALSTGSII